MEEIDMAKQTKLIQGYSAASIGKNISYELGRHRGMSQAQAVAIALSTARSAARAAKKPGIVRKYTPK